MLFSSKLRFTTEAPLLRCFRGKASRTIDVTKLELGNEESKFLEVTVLVLVP